MTLTSVDLEQALRSLGLVAGDSLIVHSSFRSLRSFDGDPQDVLDTILRVIGLRGNLMLPTFNYSRPLPEPHFDPARTPCRTGVIPELGRQRADAVRSLHPTHSVAVIGPDAATLTERHLDGRTFGIGSPIDRLAQRGGKVFLLGVDHTTNSTIHVAEEHAGVPKVNRPDRPPSAKVLMPDGRVIEHPLDSSPSCSLGFQRIAPFVQAARVTLGDCLLQMMDGGQLIATVVQQLAADPTALLCDNPACSSCRGVERSIAGR